MKICLAASASIYRVSVYNHFIACYKGFSGAAFARVVRWFAQSGSVSALCCLGLTVLVNTTCPYIWPTYVTSLACQVQFYANLSHSVLTVTAQTCNFCVLLLSAQPLFMPHSSFYKPRVSLVDFCQIFTIVRISNLTKVMCIVNHVSV